MEETRSFSQFIYFMNRPVNTYGVTVCSVFIVTCLFVLFQHGYYIRNVLLMSCNDQDEVSRIQEAQMVLSTSFMVICLGPCILVDGYIKKLHAVVVCSCLGTGSSIFLITIAFMSINYSYSTYFELKFSLFRVFLCFELFIFLSVTICSSLFLDQIGQPQDFLSVTAKIFTLAVASGRSTEAFVDLIALFVRDDKFNSAVSLLVPPTIHFFVIVYFISSICRNTRLQSLTTGGHSFFKALGFLTLFTKNVADQKVLHKNMNERQFKYSDYAKKDSIAFWKIILLTLTTVPYFFIAGAISTSYYSKLSQDDSRLSVVVCVQLAAICLAVFIQLVLIPGFYTAGLRYISLPLRRMALCYAAVGIVGLIDFVMVIANQRHNPAAYSTISKSSITIHNMFPNPVSVQADQTQDMTPIILEPYKKHTLFFQLNDPVSILLINEAAQLKDYYYMSSTNTEHYVASPFGLERIKLSENHYSNHKTSSVIVICFLSICRYTFKINCFRRSRSREILRFGMNIQMTALVGDFCYAAVEDNYGESRATLSFKVTESERYFGVVETQSDLAIVEMDTTSTFIFRWWSFLTVQFTMLVFNMLFAVAHYQFLLLESPESLRTTIVGVTIICWYVGHTYKSSWLTVDGLINETAIYITFAALGISYLLFLYICMFFNTKQKLAELNRQRRPREKSLDTRSSVVNTSLRDSTSTASSYFNTIGK